MSEKDANPKTESKGPEPKSRPEISHFGDKPIHPKSKEQPIKQPVRGQEQKSGQIQKQKNKVAQAKLSDPDFAGKKAVKKVPTAKPRNGRQAKTDVKTLHETKTVILEKTEAKPAEKPEENLGPAEPVVEPEVVNEPAEKSEETPSASRRHTIPAIVRIPFAIALLVGTSLLFTWYTFLRQFDWDFGRVSSFMTDYAGQYYLTWGIIFCAMGVMAALTWKVFFTIGASFSLLSILTFVNSQKINMRGAPFLPDDLRMTGNLGQIANFADRDAIMRLVIGVILVLLATILLEVFARKTFGRDLKGKPWWERHVIIPRFTYGLVAMAGLVSLTTPLLKQKPVSWVQGMELVEWNQSINYETNGIVIGFVNNLGRMEIPEPEGYSEATMREIAERYEAKKSADKTTRKPLTEIADRVIVILDETFYDPELLTKYYPHGGGEVLPNLHKLFRNYPSGYMYSPEYGGNTANVEFEVQTGLTNYWANTIPYVTALTKTNGVMSVASITKNLGYETTAIHSYDGSMYKRNLVYPLLGYNDFITQDEMKHRDKEPGPQDDAYLYLNNHAIFQEVLDILENGPEHQMVGVITMQNHNPYWFATYPKWEFPMTGDTGGGGGDYSRNNNYQSLHEADKYLAEFLDELKKSDEKTVVLWFGDHAAGLFEKYIESENKNDRDTIHLTPYFVWTNFETEDLYTTAEVREHNSKLGITIPSSIRGVDLPTTTPNCLQNTMYNLLGAEKPAFFYLLDEVCTTTPILAHSYLEEKDPVTTQAMKDYQLVNYDVLAGKHYWDGE